MDAFDPAYTGKVFIGSSASYEDSSVVLYGMPMDWTVSFRPGSRFGPNRIRETSIGLEEYSPYLDKHLEDYSYHDAGDMMLPFGNPAKSIEIIQETAFRLFVDGKFPLGIGGEHLVTWPIMQAAYEHDPSVAFIHIDAHTDLREDYEGEPLSHATPVRKICERIGPENVYSYGVRSGEKEEFDYARTSGMHFSPFEVAEPLRRDLKELHGRSVYVSIDIDVLDPAYAPGTGTAEAGGITSKELLEAIHAIAASEVNVIGADIVEISPPYDSGDQTAIAAGKCIREMLLGWTK